MSGCSRACGTVEVIKMREILFRGKRKDNGEWIEGSLLNFRENTYIITLREKPWANVRKANNDVLDSIKETATAMQKGLIKINPAIKEWKTEAEGYVWDDKSPIKINDHYMDSMRYFVKTSGIAKTKSNYKAVW